LKKCREDPGKSKKKTNGGKHSGEWTDGITPESRQKTLTQPAGFSRACEKSRKIDRTTKKRCRGGKQKEKQMFSTATSAEEKTSLKKIEKGASLEDKRYVKKNLREKRRGLSTWGREAAQLVSIPNSDIPPPSGYEENQRKNRSQGNEGKSDEDD